MRARWRLDGHARSAAVPLLQLTRLRLTLSEILSTTELKSVPRGFASGPARVSASMGGTTAKLRSGRAFAALASSTKAAMQSTARVCMAATFKAFGAEELVTRDVRYRRCVHLLPVSYL